MVPIYNLLPGAAFRIEGKSKIYIKIDNTALIPIQNYDEAGLMTTITYEGGSHCKTSSGRIIIKKSFVYVEEVI